MSRIEPNPKALEMMGKERKDFFPSDPPENFLLELAAEHELRICELELFGGNE